ncbi:MAG: hypothetical protein VKS61_05730 [Candidatus Sericytochromatia bacterium]|nr:hypothetical protein [Candidatus Sericytochromatia bacterium]
MPERPVWHVWLPVARGVVRPGLSALPPGDTRRAHLPGRLLRLRAGARRVSLEPFRVEVPSPAGLPWLPDVERSLLAEGPRPLRWAIVEARGETLVIEGVRWCSPPST